MTTTNVLGLTLTLTPAALTAIRIAPLLSSTASITHAYMEWVTTSSFLSPAPIHSTTSRFIMGAKTDSKKTSDKTPSGKDCVGTLNGQNSATGTNTELAKAKELVIPDWFTQVFNTAVFSVVGFNSLTLMSASVNLLVSFKFPRIRGQESTKFYAAGLVAAVAHYAFVPLVGRSIRGLMRLCAGLESGGEGKAVQWMREWVEWHTIRMVTVDAIAWVCFAWGVVGEL